MHMWFLKLLLMAHKHPAKRIPLDFTAILHSMYSKVEKTIQDWKRLVHTSSLTIAGCKNEGTTPSAQPWNSQSLAHSSPGIFGNLTLKLHQSTKQLLLA